MAESYEDIEEMIEELKSNHSLAIKKIMTTLESYTNLKRIDPYVRKYIRNTIMEEMAKLHNEYLKILRHLGYSFQPMRKRVHVPTKASHANFGNK